MASLFGHAVAAIAIGTSYPEKMTTWKFFILGILCAIVPDIDVIAFRLGIPYSSFWGHRGFTHSLFFALILSLSITFLFYRQTLSQLKGLGYILFFTLCTTSHSILDAMTTGGLGVAFLSPWDNTRYFFPWRPITVSPIGIKNFFSAWGLNVIKNEIIWIGIPCTVYMVFLKFIRIPSKS